MCVANIGLMKNMPFPYFMSERSTPQPSRILLRCVALTYENLQVPNKGTVQNIGVGVEKVNTSSDKTIKLKNF